MQVAVLDYLTSKVFIHKNVPDMEDWEDIEDYLFDKCGYHIENIHWMKMENGIVYIE